MWIPPLPPLVWCGGSGALLETQPSCLTYVVVIGASKSGMDPITATPPLPPLVWCCGSGALLETQPYVVAIGANQSGWDPRQ